jgi:hypothetical protein
MCGHGNPLNLRLMTYTRYGAMVGCLSCGTSWFISVPGHNGEADGGGSVRTQPSAGSKSSSAN